MATRKEKNNREFNNLEQSNRGIPGKNTERENKYTDENYDATDTDAAESNPRIKQASQVSGNTIEEGDEDYDDEKEEGNNE